MDEVTSGSCPLFASCLLDKIFNNYHWSMGRLTKELYAMLGVMILQQMHDLTDESDQASYLCPKTLWAMRFFLTQKNLYGVLFESVTDHLAKVFLVVTSKQRCDSVHIFSNMRHLGHIGLFRHTIKKFLINVKRHHEDLFEGLDKGLTDRYLSNLDFHGTGND